MVKNMFRSIVVALGTFALLGLGGCTSEFYEINSDPDALTEGSPTNQLGYVMRYTAVQYGSVDATEKWAGYVANIQYSDDYQYTPSNNTYGNKFACAYRSMEQLNDVLSQTEETADEVRSLRWAVRIWEQFLWLWTTDSFGPIPYTEACKVGEDITSPKYDSQETIYTGILSDLKTIADEMATQSATGSIGSGDFVFGGDVTLWRKFCNSLRLRAAMRIVNVSESLARSTIEEIAGNLTTYPILDKSSDNAYLYWPGDGIYNEPWADNFLTRDDHGMCEVFIDYLLGTEDPRLHVVANSLESNTGYTPVEGSEGPTYVGYYNGATSAANPLSGISRMGSYYRENLAGFTAFLKSCENYFILAEAALRGWNVGISAQDAYEKAVQISMDDNNISAEDAQAYMEAAGEYKGTLEQVYMEEWVALFKNFQEAWSFYRRTGYPKLIPESGNYPGDNCAYGAGVHNDVPFRMPYPENEYNYNSDNLNSAIANVVDYTWGEQMWWDTRTGVY